MESTSTKILKKVLRETKEKKEKLLIEETLVKSRILMIVESEDNIKNVHQLSKSKKRKIAVGLMEEINFLSENGMMNEQLGDFLTKMFGNSLGGFTETLVEPIVNSLLSAIGIGGYFKNFLVSFLTSRPLELAKALKDCRVLTTLIANSLAEAFFMMIQQKQGLEGKFYDFLRNTLGGVVKDTAFVNKIEDFIGDTVCQIFNKYSKNAENLLGKIKGSGLAPGMTGS